MAYTRIQDLRKTRARNKGVSRKLAARLRRTLAWLERKGPEEFSRPEIKDLQALREMLNTRLYLNALTKSKAEFTANPAKFKLPNGRFRIELNKKEL
jgi:hypothetical protein